MDCISDTQGDSGEQQINTEFGKTLVQLEKRGIVFMSEEAKQAQIDSLKETRNYHRFVTAAYSVLTVLASGGLTLAASPGAGLIALLTGAYFVSEPAGEWYRYNVKIRLREESPIIQHK
ncbi:hypothetical protein KY328_04805 [Candidatus Woesearchaeota archaeon]|nr:hypothetical protein [Candidatus Woesearchaeota archaeon]MBW3022218.1 hypothetical protein [Candidatus Woesearchaeota archaeon]